MRYSKLLHCLSVALLITVICACNDSSTNIDNEPPVLPQLSKTEADVSFFINNDDGPETDAFNDAGDFLIPVYIYELGINFLYEELVNAANQTKPVFENGLWVWTYTYIFSDGEPNEVEISVRLTAEVGGQATEWKLYGSADTQEGTFENVLLLSGSVQNGGKSGSWVFRNMADGSNSDTFVKISETNWTWTSETEKTITLTVYNEADVLLDVDRTFSFEINGPEHNVVGEGTPDMPDATIFWNTETSEGYIIQNGQKRCWDSSLKDVPC